MADVLTPDQRSYNMSQIKSKDTKPEEIVRKYLFSKGLRYRKNDKRYLGHPDIVLPKYKTVGFVHGCFWHMHEGCHYWRFPKSNSRYWEEKLRRNRQRDIQQQKELREAGWKVFVVWECELNKNRRLDTLEKLFYEITERD